MHGTTYVQGNIISSKIESLKHVGIISDQIDGLRIDILHGSTAIAAHSLKNVFISATHKPLLLDLRQTQEIENVNIQTVHSDLYIAVNNIDNEKLMDLAMKIRFDTAHGKLKIINTEDMNDITQENTYRSITTQPTALP